MNDFTQLIDLASARLGGHVPAANDEFFAPCENLLKPEPAVFIPDKYTERGKWMDGWETRRRREPGHDWCVIALGLPGVIRGVNVDTSHFRGNHPEACSIDACTLEDDPAPDAIEALPWKEVLARQILQGDSDNLFEIRSSQRCTHLRLHIYPDGGVARLRVHGQVRPEVAPVGSEPIDLAAVENGGEALVCSDMFFSSRHNLLMPGRGVNMGDGWETRRRRGPGFDWVIIRLGARGTIRSVLVDSLHFKGNYPDRCRLEGCDVSAGATVDELVGHSTKWTELLGEQKLSAHAEHRFDPEAVIPVSHVRLSIVPDGGISRLRLFGHPVESGS